MKKHVAPIIAAMLLLSNVRRFRVWRVFGGGFINEQVRNDLPKVFA